MKLQRKKPKYKLTSEGKLFLRIGLPEKNLLEVLEKHGGSLPTNKIEEEYKKYICEKLVKEGLIEVKTV